ncbi:MAG: hypothetical protein GXP31_17080 [Kiritimatiellaeota bacterium]|nr:hypothetical protein [Kiritimatiellota bacterium]
MTPKTWTTGAIVFVLNLVGMAAPPRTPLLCPPVARGRIVLDGKLDEPAWRDAQQALPVADIASGAAVRRQPTVLVLRDATTLYVGARLPKPKGVRPKTAATKHDGPVWADDALEVFLDPGRTRSKYFQFVVNAAGVRWDSSGKDNRWNAPWRAAVSTTPDTTAWTTEIAIPFASLGGPPQPGAAWGFNVAWDRQTPSARVMSWAAMRGTLHQPDAFGLLRFTANAPSVRAAEIRLSPRRGKVVLGLRVAAADGPVTLRWWFGPADRLVQRQQAIVAKGSAKTVTFRSELPRKDGLPEQTGPCTGIVTARDKGTDLFRAVVEMTIPPPLDFTVRKYLLQARRIEVEFQGGLLVEKLGGTGRVECTLTAVGGKRPASSGRTALDKAGRGTVTLDIRDVRPGRYELSARAFAADGKTVFNRHLDTLDLPPRPEWLGNREGFSDNVLAPWTPIEVRGSAVRPALREYRWGALPFPESVTARDKSMLAGPIRLIAVVDGRKQVWRGSGPNFSKKTPARVEFSTQARSADAAVRGNLWCEYDGCIRCDWELTLERPDTRLDSLVLEIPYRAEHARYLYHYPGRWRSRFNAGALPPEGAMMGFRPFVWLGDEWRGFAWFCPSDEAFRPGDPNRVTEIVRQGDTVLLRIHLLDKPELPGQSFRARFGFEATPVRSNPEDVWDYRIVHTGNYGLEKRPWSPPLSVRWPANGNLDVREGTLEAWVRPQFDPNVPVKPGDPGRGRFNRNFFLFDFGGWTVGYYWNIDDRGMRLYIRSPDGKYPVILGARCNWKKGEWRHVAFSWGRELRLYNDGKLVARRSYRGLLPVVPRDLRGGSIRLGGGQCDMDVDDFTVSNEQHEPRGAHAALAPDGHALLLESFDTIARTPSGVHTVPTTARGGRGTADPDVRMVPGRFGSAAALAYHGPPVTTLDHYRKLGVRTICFHEHWSRIQNYFAPADPEGLRRLVKACHERGIRLLVYYGYELSNIAPEWDLYRDEILVRPRAGGYHRQPEQRCYICCYRSPWQDYLARAIAQTMDEYGVDGVYLDGTANPHGCANSAHGCGWTDAGGRRHRTYPFFAVRQMMKRIYTIVKTRNPTGLVNVHQSTCMTIPSVGWATSYWDGEQFGGIPRDPKNRPLDVLPLDAFRTEFMGRNWGVPAEMLCYGRPYTYAEALAIALPHDVLVRPNNIELAASIWKTAADFGRKQARWLPYWENGAEVAVTPAAVKCSLYTRGARGVLAVISNLGDSPAAARIALDRRRLGLSGKLRARDALSDKSIPCPDGVLNLKLQPLEFRLLIISK